MTKLCSTSADKAAMPSKASIPPTQPFSFKARFHDSAEQVEVSVGDTSVVKMGMPGKMQKLDVFDAKVDNEGTLIINTAQGQLRSYSGQFSDQTVFRYADENGKYAPLGRLLIRVP
jgi:hypothetical protein